MILNYKVVGNGYAPVRQHKQDAGFDLHTPVDFGIHGQSYKFLMLEVCVEIPDGYVGLILGRSSRSKNGVNVLDENGKTYEVNAVVKTAEFFVAQKNITTHPIS